MAGWVSGVPARHVCGKRVCARRWTGAPQLVCTARHVECARSATFCRQKRVAVTHRIYNTLLAHQQITARACTVFHVHGIICYCIPTRMLHLAASSVIPRSIVTDGLQHVPRCDPLAPPACVITRCMRGAPAHAVCDHDASQHGHSPMTHTLRGDGRCRAARRRQAAAGPTGAGRALRMHGVVYSFMPVGYRSLEWLNVSGAVHVRQKRW